MNFFCVCVHNLNVHYLNYDVVISMKNARFDFNVVDVYAVLQFDLLHLQFLFGIKHYKYKVGNV